MKNKCDKYNKKILENKNNNIFIVFYSSWCPICNSTFNLLKTKNKSYKGYEIDKKGNISILLECLKKNKKITGFNPKHKTRPIIFKNGQFIGGFDNLQKYLS